MLTIMDSPLHTMLIGEIINKIRTHHIVLEFCMGINDQRVALMTSVNIFLNSNDFNSLSMKDKVVIYLNGCRI